MTPKRKRLKKIAQSIGVQRNDFNKWYDSFSGTPKDYSYVFSIENFANVSEIRLGDTTSFLPDAHFGVWALEPTEKINRGLRREVITIDSACDDPEVIKKIIKQIGDGLK